MAGKRSKAAHRMTNYSKTAADPNQTGRDRLNYGSWFADKGNSELCQSKQGAMKYVCSVTEAV